MIASLDLRDLVVRSVTQPRAVAHELIALNLPLEARLLGLGIVVAMTGALGTLAEILFAFVTKLDQIGVSNPLPMSLAQGGLILYGAFAMSAVGRWFGGQGRFADALLLLVWMEFVLSLAQIVQVVVMVFFPLTAVMASFAMLALMFWLLVQFTAALHGFTNMGQVVMGVIATFFASALIAGVLLISLGITVLPLSGQGV